MLVSELHGVASLTCVHIDRHHLQLQEPGDVTGDGDERDRQDVVPSWPAVAQLEEREADSDVALQGETNRQQDGAIESDVGQGQQDGDQTGEGPGGGDLRPEQGHGEY